MYSREARFSSWLSSVAEPPAVVMAGASFTGVTVTVSSKLPYTAPSEACTANT